jgi:hypothetical protein
MTDEKTCRRCGYKGEDVDHAPLKYETYSLLCANCKRGLDNLSAPPTKQQIKAALGEKT